ncbi:hypothetical protein [Anaerococcus tetradius]|uniref:hypothetical protein n=1 Tax=Anaerococcus tetradius TaxID=33036 RepID=UPI0023F40C73|nr:hypothetical protein [Anaerococcus tetradius]
MKDRITDFIQVSSYAFRNTFSKIRKLYLAFIFIFIRIFLDVKNIIGLVGGGSFVGLLNYIIDVLILCYIAQALRSVVVYGNPGKKSIGNSISIFFQPLISAMFYLYIVKLGLNLLTMGANPRGEILVFFIVKVLSSPILEEVYINNKTGLDALKSSVKFVLDNPLTYGIYAIIFIGIESYLGLKLGANTIIGIRNLYISLILALIHTFFSVFRGHLFKYIDEHPYRQRKFMRG